MSGPCRMLRFAASLVLPFVVMSERGPAAEVAGVKLQIVSDSGPAVIKAVPLERHKFRIEFDPKTETKPLELGIELAVTGLDAWPAVDVEVRDSEGKPVAVRHPGIEWHKMHVTVPPRPGTYVVQTVDPGSSQPKVLPEKERHVTSAGSGASATICKWHGGRRAALSIRFDDSHSTHLSMAVPILNEYGFRGTFMVNPGAPDGRSPNPRWRSAFQDHRREWEAVARSGKHEFANHTFHHRGARNDREMEHEVGEASKAIWKLFPKKSKLLALNLGGGTSWTTTKPLRYYLDKYHLFDASSGSTGMDDVYGNRVPVFRKLLETHIERAGWYRVHYHYLGKGLSTSEANCRAALDVAKEHESQLWIAGMAEIHKYQTERLGTKLTIADEGPDHLVLRLTCVTDVEFYDEPLTLEVTLPESWSPERVTVKNAGETVASQRQQVNRQNVLRFDVAPRSASFRIQTAR